MALVDDINNLPEVPADGSTGHLVNHRTIHTALKNHQSRLDGVEGRIPDALKLARDTTVGTRITAGSTLIYGDTGWRNVTSLFDIAPNSGALRIKRTAQMVHLQATNLQWNNGVTATIDLPSSWWTGNSTGLTLYNPNGIQAAFVNAAYTGALKFIWNTTNSATCLISLPSDATWPSSLIGA